MFRREVLEQLKNEEEALAIISALGFFVRDWSFIKKIGGAKKLIVSDIVLDILQKKSQPTFLSVLKNLRELFDAFYASGGFLISCDKRPKSGLFKHALSPLVFFGRFDQELLGSFGMVSIVGSRLPSKDAVLFTKKLSSKLSEQGIVVVSGGAMGIDAAAHEAACKTIVVSGMACNLTKEERFRGRKNLAVIYPFGPFMPQGKFMFLARNRYVAALSDAVVIIQGKRGSGTLSTANAAESFGTTLFALPGAIDDPLAFVPNQLLAKGVARAIIDPSQFVLALVTKSNGPPKRSRVLIKEGSKMPEQEPSLPYLLQVIKDHESSLGLDELLAITHKSFADVQRELLTYEMDGRIVKRGSQFVLTDMV